MPTAAPETGRPRRFADRTHAVPALAMCLLAAFSFGLAYAARDGNQVTYLLDGLRRVDPDFLRSDWLAAETFAYHPTFAWVIIAAAALGSVPWVLALLNIAIITASLWLIHRLLRDFVPDAALAATAALVALVVIGGTQSVAMTYIFSRELQPSGLAALALIGAITAFVRGRWVVSGLALAASGALHSNFLLVGLAAFGLAHMLLAALAVRADGREALGARVGAAALQLAPALVVLAVQVPLLLDMAADPDGAAARRIFLEVRSPHHYMPRTYLISFLPFIAWHLLASAVQTPFDGAVRRRWLALHASMFALVLAATLLTTVVFVPVVSQLFFWRLAPFSVLMAQVSVVAGAALWLERRIAGVRVDEGGDWRRARIAAAAAALVLFLRRAVWSSGIVSPSVVGLAITAAAVAFIVRQAAHGRGGGHFPSPQALMLVALTVAGVLGISEGRRRSNLLGSDLTPAERSLFAWASRTHPDARFLVPPDLSTFRLGARRAIVVDWKSTPILPAELLEWYRRIDAVAGGTGPKTIEEAAAGYRGLDVRHLAWLLTEFDADYAVVPVDARIARAPADHLPVAWQNEAYLVLAGRDIGGRPAATISPGASAPAR